MEFTPCQEKLKILYYERFIIEEVDLWNIHQGNLQN